MKFLDLFIRRVDSDVEVRSRKQKKSNRLEDGDFTALYYGGNGGNYTQEKALLLSAVYRCVDVISNSVAALPFEPYRLDSQGYKTKYFSHYTYDILNLEPNKRMSRFTFLKTLVSSVLLNGNGYAYIERESNGKVRALHYIPAEMVVINPPDTIDQPVTYSVTAIKGEVQAKDMIHILNFSYDGISGVSTLTHAANSLKLGAAEDNHARGFFTGGCSVGGILTVNSVMSPDAKKNLKASWHAAFNPESGRPNSVAVLEGDMSYTPVGINAADSQLLESRQFSVIDICRFFGVSPVKCFDLSKSSYNTVEATELSFLTDTLSPILAKIELEFDRKIFAGENGITVNFDINKCLKADKSAQTNYYNQMFQIGIMSINEIRRELDMSAIENGDTHFTLSNIMPLQKAVNNTPTDSVIAQSVKPSDKNIQDQENNTTEEKL